MSIITISHEAFGAGRAVAQRVAEILGYRCLSREVLRKANERYGIGERKLIEVLEEQPHQWWAEWLESRGAYTVALRAALCELAQEGNIVYHGRAGQEFLTGIRHVLNVLVHTPAQSRISEIMARKGLAHDTAKNYLEELDRIRARRMRELFKVDWRDPTRYDLMINTARTPLETAARTIAELSQRAEYQPTAESVQAMNDVTITARVEAVLAASLGLDISNLEVETCRGEVRIGGIISAEAVKEIAVELIRSLPGVSHVKSDFLVTGPHYYRFGDIR
jgi:cytidylate kinase